MLNCWSFFWWRFEAFTLDDHCCILLFQCHADGLSWQVEWSLTVYDGDGAAPDQDPLPVLSGPALLDPEVSIPKAAEILFSCPPGERYAIVHRAFSPDATYYNSFVRSLPLSMPNCVVH